MKSNLTRLILAVFLVLGTAPWAAAQNIQIIHNSPDPSLDSVDIYIVTPFGSYAYQDFKFRQTSKYVSIPAGLSASVGVAPGNSSSAADTFASIDVSPIAGKSYVYVLQGLRDPSKFTANPDGRNLSFHIREINNVRSDASVNGAFDFFLLNGSPDDSAMIVTLRSNSGNVILKSNFRYGDTAGYFSLPSGNYVMDVYKYSDSSFRGTYSLNLPTNPTNNVGVLIYSGFMDSVTNKGHKAGWFMELPVGTAALIGQTKEVPRATKAMVQFIHNSADPTIQKVDIYDNGTKLVEDLNFRAATMTMNVEVNSGGNTFGIAPGTSTSSSEAIFTAKMGLRPLDRYIVITKGVTNPANFKANPNGISINFGLSVIAGKEVSDVKQTAEIKTFHGVTDLGYVDVRTGDGTTIFNSGPYSSATANYYVLSPQKTTFEVWDSAQTSKKGAFRMDLAQLQDSTGILLLSGFADPANNQNGPQMTTILVASNGMVYTATDVTSVQGMLNNGLACMVYPNPANGVTHIAYRLEKSAPVQLNILDATGRVVLQANEGQQAAGSHTGQMDMSHLSAGVYMLELRAGDQVARQRVIVK